MAKIVGLKTLGLTDLNLFSFYNWLGLIGLTVAYSYL